MVIVDTHVHASPYWYEPIEVLLFQMNSNRVDKATLIQFTDQTDNRYIIECARRFPGRFSPVVIVDTQKPDASEVLRRWVKKGAEGIRLRAVMRSQGKDPLAIWRTCAELKLPVSCAGREHEFGADEFYKLVQEVPDAPIVIEHLGHPKLDGLSLYETYRKVLALAKFPNIYIKVPGLGEICKRPHPFQQPFYSVHGVPPLIKMVYEAFGPKRMMWGSNYPPSSQLEGYANTLCYLVEHLASFCSEEDRKWIMGKTALSIFKFKEEASMD